MPNEPNNNLTYQNALNYQSLFNPNKAVSDGNYAKDIDLQFTVSSSSIPFSINSSTLPYTNIAGSSFQPYVATQIEKRKALLDKEYRDSSELNWLSNKNVWIRISSGVNVKSGNTRYQGLEGDELSKKYILQGGVLNHLPGPDTYTLRSGIGSDGAYGIGGTNFGLTPMPGLTNISIKTGGKLGTLKETTFDFVCHNIEQLSIMEALYMKLGFGVLVEWGHTFYISNDTGKIESTPQPLPFYGIKTKEDLMEKITTHRKLHSGNYDASWGTVKNFSYTLDENGKFKCQVQLVGAGDILESLKINQSGKPESTPPPQSEEMSIYPVVSDFNLSFLNEILYEIFSINFQPSEIEGYKTVWYKDYIELLQKYYNNNLGINFGYNSDKNTFKFTSKTLEASKGYHFSILNKSNNIDIPDIDVTKVFSKFVLECEIDDQGLDEYNTKITDQGLNQSYITLAHLCYLIMNSGIIYDVVDSKKSPHIYIDCNPETNRSYTFSGHCSLDPTVCLIGSESLPFSVKSKMFDKIKASFPYYDSNTPEAGRFMYTLVNINFITSILRKYQSNDIKGDVYLVDFLKDILDGISKACGSYNEFRIVPDEDSNCIRILDNRTIKNLNTYIDNPINNYTEIPILGKKSIVYNFNYTSKISPNTAAMVVVAAQAQPYVLNSEEALAFSHLNNGLINRLATSRIGSTQEITPTPQSVENNDQRYIELRDLIIGIYGGTEGVLTQQEIQQNQQDLSTYSQGTVTGVSI